MIAQTLVGAFVVVATQEGIKATLLCAEAARRRPGRLSFELSMHPLVRPVLLGRVIQPADERGDAPRVSVLSDGLWRRQFGGGRDTAGRARPRARDGRALRRGCWTSCSGARARSGSASPSAQNARAPYEWSCGTASGLCGWGSRSARGIVVLACLSFRPMFLRMTPLRSLSL